MNKKTSGLGRGLGSLIPQRAAATPSAPSIPSAPSASGQPLLVPVARLVVNPEQPRLSFRHHELEELTESIRQHGIIQPLVVTPRPDGNFEIVAGERRLRAAKLLNLPNVPVIVRPAAGGRDKLVLALIENLQREDLNPMEEARAYQRLSQEFSLTQEEIAKKVGKSRPAVANTVRLLELPEEIRQAVADGRLSAGSARAILGLNDDKSRLAFFRKMMAGNKTTREAEAGVRRVSGRRGRKDPAVAAAEDQLRQALGARVEIRKRSGKGSIAVSFYSEEEYADLVRKLGRK